MDTSDGEIKSIGGDITITAKGKNSINEST